MDQPECPGCRERDARLAVLEAKVAELEARLHDLTKPPAPPRPAPALPKGPAKQPTGKKAGGQPGHPPHLKMLLPAERVNEFVEYVPATCAHCQTALPQEPGPLDPPPTRHQVAELPKLAAIITEYQGHGRTCPCCGKVTQMAIPEAIRADSVGPNLTARCRISLAVMASANAASKKLPKRFLTRRCRWARWPTSNKKSAPLLRRPMKKPNRRCVRPRSSTPTRPAGKKTARNAGCGSPPRPAWYIFPYSYAAQHGGPAQTARRRLAWYSVQRPLVRLRRLAH